MAAPQTRLRRVLKALGSLKAAVAIIFAVAAGCLIALFAEGSHGAEFAQQHFYRSWWFTGLLLALVVNVAASAAVRYPWSRRLTGFVVTHAGLLLLLAGALITRFWGIEGQVILAEGERADAIRLPGQEVAIRLADGTSRTLSAEDLQSRVGAGPCALAGSDWQVAVEGWLPASRPVEAWAPDASGQGPTVIHCTVPDPRAGTVDVWLRPDDAAHRTRELGALRFEAQRLGDADALAGFLQPVPPPPPGEAGTVVVNRPDAPAVRVPVQTCLGAPVDLGNGVTLTVTRVLRNATVRQGTDEEWIIEETALEGAGPAVEAVLRSNAGEEAHAAFARHPEMASRRGDHAGQAAAGYRLVYEFDGPIAGPVISIGVTADGRAFARTTEPEQTEPSVARPVQAGAELSSLGIRLAALWPAAQRDVDMALAAPDDRGRTPPALQLQFIAPSGGGRAGGWIRLGEPRRLPHPAGAVDCVWRPASLPLGFELALLDFRKTEYPGSGMPAAYESDVRVTDRARGRSETVTVAMNQPLRHGAVWGLPGTGWAFYQSSFMQPPSGPEISIFSAAFDPGYSVVLLGSLTLIVGIFIQIALTGMLARPRRAARPEAAAPSGETAAPTGSESPARP